MNSFISTPNLRQHAPCTWYNAQQSINRKVSSDNCQFGFKLLTLEYGPSLGSPKFRSTLIQFWMVMLCVGDSNEDGWAAGN